MSDPKPTEAISECCCDLMHWIDRADKGTVTKILTQYFGNQSAQVKQLQEENARLRDAIQSIEDVSHSFRNKNLIYQLIHSTAYKALNSKEPI